VRNEKSLIEGSGKLAILQEVKHNILQNGQKLNSFGKRIKRNKEL
jgi:hypothetical protein